MYSKVRSKINFLTVTAGVFFLVIFVMPGFFFGDLFTAINHFKEKGQWYQTMGIVISSQLKHSPKSCDNLKINIEYGYLRNKEKQFQYKSSKYSLQDCWPIGEKAKRAILEEYKPGNAITIHVHKKNPNIAVIKLDYLPVFAFGLLPILLIIPLSFIVLLILRKFDFAKPHLEKIEFKPSEYYKSNDSTKLAPDMSAKTLFLSVIGAIFVLHLSFLSMFPMIYIVPIELLVIGYFGLKTLSPAIDLELSMQDIHPGDEITIHITPHGRTRLIEDLKISLISRERTETGSDKSRSVNYHETYNNEVFQVSNLRNFNGDDFKLTIPKDAMPSFSMYGSEIQWFLHIKCQVKRLPNISKKYLFHITPKLSNKS